jgi:transposase
LIKIDRGDLGVEDGGMSMGRKADEQKGLFVPYTQLPRSSGHPFYVALEGMLRENQFDRFAERVCRKFYSHTGRPGLAPGMYFRCLMVGYFEGLDSERGIAWRVADSLSLREFVGLEMGRQAPDQSTISRTRRLIDLETHRAVFTWVLRRLAEGELLRAHALGVDGTTLEANAAMKSIVRWADGRTYQEFLTGLAQESGIETPTREDLARLDRKRKKKTSNEEWVSPSDPDAQITKMKDGRTHLAHKQEHAVDLDSGAVVAVTLDGGAKGDTTTVDNTIAEAERNLADARPDRSAEEPKPAIVGDKGYHSKRAILRLALAGHRTYISEPQRGRQRWEGERLEQQAVYANRRRKNGVRGRRLMRRRGELVERSFAHVLDTGGMRRTHLRGHENILKRALVHVAAFNLSLLMRKMLGFGTPRGLQGRAARLLSSFAQLIQLIFVTLAPLVTSNGDLGLDTERWSSLRQSPAVS